MPILFNSQLANGYQEFSNMYPCIIKLGNRLTFYSVEQFYQYSKFIDTDVAWAELIQKATDPYDARMLGQSKSDEMDQNWESNNIGILNWALRIKFADDDQLSQLLLDTGNEDLINIDPDDKFWGQNPETGFGENMLGQCLMKVRNEIRVQVQSENRIQRQNRILERNRIRIFEQDRVQVRAF